MLVFAGTLLAKTGMTYYKNELTEASFWVKQKLAQALVSQEEDMQLFTSAEKDYTEKLEYLQENGTLRYEESEYLTYEIEEAEFMDWGCKNNCYRKMYLDQKTLYEICSFYLNLDSKKIREIRGDFTSNIQQLLYEVESLQINVKSFWEYNWTEECLEIAYDPLDDRVFYVEFQTYDKAKMENYLDKVLPFCCPETYLKEDEIEKIFMSIEADENSALCLNEKAWIYAYAFQTEEKTSYCCRIATCYINLL